MKTTTEAHQTLSIETLGTITGGAAWQQPAQGAWGGAAGGSSWAAKPAQSWSPGWTGGASTNQWSGK